MGKTKLKNNSLSVHKSGERDFGNDDFRILAEGHFMNNDSYVTGLNNNDMVIGPSGAGKTRSYVIPNILHARESLVVADTKGNLCRLLGPILRKKGYKVKELNFKDMKKNTYGYNPLDFIRRDKKTGKPVEQDILRIAKALTPIQDFNQPFWEYSARNYIECLVGYAVTYLPKEEQNLMVICKLASYMGTAEFQEMFSEAIQNDPDGFVARRYNHIKTTADAEKMDASIRSIVFEKLLPFSFREAENMFNAKQRVSFLELGKKKMVLFLNISDTDRSLDPIVSLLYEQAFHGLCEVADNSKDSRLKVPVRFIMDDFATNTLIDGFDNLISVIRSRSISVSIIIQSISQLEALYGEAKSSTIINNCDNCLYLGGTDVKTAQFMAIKLNKMVQSVLYMPLDQAILFTRGQVAQYVKKYDYAHCQTILLSNSKEKQNGKTKEDRTFQP